MAAVLETTSKTMPDLRPEGLASLELQLAPREDFGKRLRRGAEERHEDNRI